MVDRDLVRRLEDVGDATWPALAGRDAGGWRLRYAAGVTRRSNSATWIGPGDPVAAVRSAERWLAERLDVVTFRITPLAGSSLDEALASLGYDRDAGAHTMTRALGSGADCFSIAPGIAVRPEPDLAWWRTLGATGADRGNPSAMRRLIAALQAPTAFASREVDGVVVAVGMGVVEGEYVAIFNMNTVAALRRAGHGTAILDALLAWGSDHGAVRAFLQVHPDNRGALDLYGGAGFVTQYDYHYRAKPAAG